jgi:hypothetical protein
MSEKPPSRPVALVSVRPSAPHVQAAVTRVLQARPVPPGGLARPLAPPPLRQPAPHVQAAARPVQAKNAPPVVHRPPTPAARTPSPAPPLAARAIQTFRPSGNPRPVCTHRGVIQRALVRNNAVIHDKFYDDHLRDSQGRPTLDLIREGIESCRNRHGRQNVPANTILYVDQATHDTFANHGGTLAGYQSNIVVPVAITMTQMGRILLRTGTQFNYGVRNMHAGYRVYHYAGMTGGVETDLNLRRYRQLAGVRMYAARKWPNIGRGWTAVDETVDPDAVSATYASTVQDANYETYKLVKLFLRNNARLREDNFYYVKSGDLFWAPAELWFTYNGTHHQL